MKLVRSDGRRLEVRDVGEPLLVLVADRGVPLKHVDEIEDDDAARERVRTLLALGLYRREK